ncbi:MAG: DNA primase [Desulfobacterales bacterium]|nr:DNA primase [Desulfobacterales bacterium]
MSKGASVLAGFIPEDKISDIRNSSDIVDVISEYVALKKAGKNFSGLCPFHAEKLPSFTVSPEKQIFHCFGCGQGGNAFTFVMQYHNLSFPESVRFLAQKYGIEIPARQMSAAQKRKLEEKERLLKINQAAAEYFKEVLSDSTLGKPGRDYFSRRQMTPQIIDRFMLGHAPGGWNNLVRYFSKKGVPLDDVEKAGLVIARKIGYYDRFRDRAIFPIFDIHERVVGFGGRSLDESLPKYLNSPETPVYHKSRTLYGLHAAKGACRQSGSVLIVEGYFDLLALHCHGMTNVVATLGTALTKEHLRVLKGYAEQVVLVFDSDEAGMKAAERSLALFMAEKTDARIMILPEGKDPDSFVFEVGGEGFRQVAEQALGIMGFLMASAIKKYGLSLEGKVRIVEALTGPLGSLADGVSRAVYVRDLAERLDIDESAILEQIRTSADKNKKSVSAVKHRHGSKLEETIVAMMLQYPEISSSFNAQEIVESLETTALKNVGRMILDRVRANKAVTGADLIAQTQDAQIRKVISSLSFEEMSWDRDSCLKIVAQYQASLRKQQEKLLLRKIREAEKSNNETLLHELLTEKQRQAQHRVNAL